MVLESRIFALVAFVCWVRVGDVKMDLFGRDLKNGLERIFSKRTPKMDANLRTANAHTGRSLIDDQSTTTAPKGGESDTTPNKREI